MKKISINVAFFASVIFIAGCDSGSSGNVVTSDADADAGTSALQQLEQKCREKDEELGVVRPDGWQASSHCKYAAGDVGRVFPQDKVSKLAIRMTAQDFASMQANLEEVLSGGGLTGVEPDTQGGDTLTPVDSSPDADIAVDDTANQVGGNSEAMSTDPCGGQTVGNACTQGQHTGVCAQTTGPMICQIDEYDVASNLEDTGLYSAFVFYDEKPSYFRADIEFDGVVYTSVGIRYKGNSSLAFSNTEKKPLRLKLDEWEEETPDITNQRMFGFQKLSLAPNVDDPTQMHQVLAASTFREHGVPAPHSSFIEVTLDIGDGPELLGLYAMTEVPDNPLLDRYFSNNDGNLYKPDGRGAHFVSFSEESFHKKNNKDTDFGDVIKFVNALNASRSDRDAWRSALTSSFDIEGFIDFMAVNQIIVNWDTYGTMPHNFYFYTDEESEQISFIPWDFDNSFETTVTSDFTLRSFDGSWPLLQAIARDVEYATLYQERLSAIGQSEFSTGLMKQRIDKYAALIQDAVARENTIGREGAIDLTAGVDTLKGHIDSQQTILNEFLDTQVQETTVNE